MEQLAKTFALPLNKDVVRRILSTYYRPESGDGPSCLSFIGHTKDSLWSLDFFQCESLQLTTHWVLLVMDQSTRRIIGSGIHSGGDADGKTLCRLFFQTIKRGKLPQYLSFDHDPLFRFHQ